MIRELVRDEAVLSQPCEAATVADEAVAHDLLETLASLEDAGCLAANQIGEMRAVCAFKDDDDTPRVMYNPRLAFGLGAGKVPESCLTREGTVTVTRYAKVKIRFDELVDGALKPRTRDYVGFTAQMIQHMIDHCRGRLV